MNRSVMGDLGPGGSHPDLERISTAPNEALRYQDDLGPPPVAINTVTELLRLNTLYIAFHEPLFASDGSIEDLKLLWWNENYASIRVKPPARGTLASTTYIKPEEVIDFATTARRVGKAREDFVIDSEASSIYDLPGRPTSLAVVWIAHGDLIIEIAEDLTQLRSTQVELEIRRLQLAEVQHRQQISQLRERLASNMHDRLIQHLFAIGIGIETVLADVADAHGLQLRSCQNQLQNTIEEIRQMVRDLSGGPSVDPTQIQRHELSTEIEEMAMAFDFAPVLHSNLREVLPAGLRYDMTAVIRESLANAARHSGASEVSVIVDQSDHQLTVVTHDNGRGFDDTQLTTSPTSRGLRNMAKRAEHYGGNLIIRSGHSGAEAIWTVPLSRS